MSIDISEWLKPVSDAAPTGEDVSFSDTFDKIREARRSDDPSLSQGDWEHDLKTANWRQVIELAGDVLANRSKDLQAAVWLGEALISQHHLAGAPAALDLLSSLLEDYWDGLFPELEGEDVEERSAKLAWFNDYGARALLGLRLSPGEGGFTVADWQVSREVDNLSRQDAQAYQEALDEGKPTGEAFDSAVLSTPDATLLQYHGDVERAMAALARYRKIVDERMGVHGPGLGALEGALKRIQQIVSKAARAKGLVGAEEAVAEEGGEAGEAGAIGAAPVAGFSFGPGDAANKAAALRAVGEIAAWFRRVEPHSPVSFLLDRAVAWADMPLDQWLQEVVPDSGTLSHIRSRIGLSD